MFINGEYLECVSSDHPGKPTSQQQASIFTTETDPSKNFMIAYFDGEKWVTQRCVDGKYTSAVTTNVTVAADGTVVIVA